MAAVRHERLARRCCLHGDEHVAARKVAESVAEVRGEGLAPLGLRRPPAAAAAAGRSLLVRRARTLVREDGEAAVGVLECIWGGDSNGSENVNVDEGEDEQQDVSTNNGSSNINNNNNSDNKGGEVVAVQQE